MAAIQMDSAKCQEVLFYVNTKNVVQTAYPALLVVDFHPIQEL